MSIPKLGYGTPYLPTNSLTNSKEEPLLSQAPKTAQELLASFSQLSLEEQKKLTILFQNTLEETQLDSFKEGD